MGGFLPTAADILATTTTSSTSVFNYLYPVAGLVLGFIIGVLVVNRVISLGSKAAHKVVGKGRRG